MSGRNKVIAYLGLGGNIGDPRSAMSTALRILDDSATVSVQAVSSLYRTPPWGLVDQPDFLNAVARIETELSPRGLLDACLSAERVLKRVRNERWGPRAIDIDVLVYGDALVSEEGLSIPHPRIAERAFVLVPLLEIAPKLIIGGVALAQALAKLDISDIVKIDTEADWWQMVD